MNIGRNAWLEAGLPIEVPATTVDRQCGSAQQGINFAAALIASGVHDVAIGGGVEHMGHISFADGFSVMQEHGMAFSGPLAERFNLVPQGISAEMIADQWEIPRSELDEIGVRSHQLAARATQEGRFEREIVPFQVNGDTFHTDQGIRPDTNIESLSKLKTGLQGGRQDHRRQQLPGLRRRRRGAADERRQGQGARASTPRAKIVDQTTVGVDPVIMLTGPIPATEQILKRNGMKIDDIDLFEVNEAFASVVAAWRREHDPDWDRVNVNGGAIALGHPLGVDRRPADDDAPARAGALRQGGRPGDDVLRRRARDRNADSAGLDHPEGILRFASGSFGPLGATGREIMNRRGPRR